MISRTCVMTSEKSSEILSDLSFRLFSNTVKYLVLTPRKIQSPVNVNRDYVCNFAHLFAFLTTA